MDAATRFRLASKPRMKKVACPPFYSKASPKDFYDTTILKQLEK
jgi:hypothetical protein